MSLHFGKIFYDGNSDAIPSSIISLGSTLQYIHLKSALASEMYYTQHSVTNEKGILRYDTSQQISIDLDQIFKLLNNNLSN